MKKSMNEMKWNVWKSQCIVYVMIRNVLTRHIQNLYEENYNASLKEGGKWSSKANELSNRKSNNEQNALPAVKIHLSIM